MKCVMKIERFEDVEAWKAGRELAKAVYEATRQRDFSRDFALVDQIRRAVVSITSNIAEGFERGGDKEFLQALSVAKGSCGEVRSQLYIALDQNYVSEKEFTDLSRRALGVSRLLSGFMKYLQQSSLRGSKYKRGSEK